MSDWTVTNRTADSDEDMSVTADMEASGEKTVSDRAHAIADSARSTARRAADQGREYVRQQIDSQADQYGERLSDTASNLHSAATQLRSSGETSLASFADAASGWLDGASKYLKDIDGERLMRDAKEFARQRPWVVIAAGLLAGVALGRFVKSGAQGTR